MVRADVARGVPAGVRGGVIAAASTIAALVPPSITAVVYGAIGNVPIAGLFLAGVVPGLMTGPGVDGFCYFFGPRRHPAPAARPFGDRSAGRAVGAADDDPW